MTLADDHFNLFAEGPTKSVAILRETLLDSRLSFKARGVLACCLARGELGTSADELRLLGTEGRAALRAAIQELEELGYATRDKFQNDQGQWQTTITLREESLTLADDRFSDVGSFDPPRESPGRADDHYPTVGQPTVGKAIAINKEDKENPSTDIEIKTKPNHEDHSAALAKTNDIAAKYVAQIGDKIAQGFGYDLAEEVRKTWTEAWTEAVAANLNPVSIGIKLVGEYVAAITDRPPDWMQVGRLVKQYGKLSIVGIEAALMRGVDENEDDPKALLKYATAVCREEKKRLEGMRRAGV